MASTMPQPCPRRSAVLPWRRGPPGPNVKETRMEKWGFCSVLAANMVILSGNIEIWSEQTWDLIEWLDCFHSSKQQVIWSMYTCICQKICLDLSIVSFDYQNLLAYWIFWSLRDDNRPHRSVGSGVPEYVGPMLALCWAYVEACWTILGLCWAMLGPSLAT